MGLFYLLILHLVPDTTHGAYVSHILCQFAVQKSPQDSFMCLLFIEICLCMYFSYYVKFEIHTQEQWFSTGIVLFQERRSTSAPEFAVLKISTLNLLNQSLCLKISLQIKCACANSTLLTPCSEVKSVTLQNMGVELKPNAWPKC